MTVTVRSHYLDAFSFNLKIIDDSSPSSVCKFLYFSASIVPDFISRPMEEGSLLYLVW